MAELPEKPSEAPLTPELRALYDYWEAASTQEARQAAWNRIVEYLREHEERVGSQADLQRQKVLDDHEKRQRRWWFF